LPDGDRRVSAVLVMLFAADPRTRFINNNPTVVMLALGFLLMIGAVLIAGSAFTCRRAISTRPWPFQRRWKVSTSGRGGAETLRRRRG
jgi:predicted tellurium resistance membrane protein TerC